MSSKPETAFRVGAVRVAIWTNTRQTQDGESFNANKVTIERTYRGRDGDFKTTGSLDAADIPKAILALIKAYDYLMCGRAETAEEPVDFSPQSRSSP